MMNIWIFAEKEKFVRMCCSVIIQVYFRRSFVSWLVVSLQSSYVHFLSCKYSHIVCLLLKFHNTKVYPQHFYIVMK